MVNASQLNIHGNLLLGVLGNKNEITEVVIPDGIAEICSFAFRDCINLKSIYIPQSVKKIDSAFMGCDNLSTVNISSLEDWCKIEFQGFSSNPIDLAHSLSLNGHLIKDLIIPESVTEINPLAFSGCESIESVEIHSGVRKIGGDAFQACRNLSKVNIHSLEDWCKIDFMNSSANPLSQARFLYLNGVRIKDLIIPNSITRINNYCFRFSVFDSVTIPDSVLTIGYFAFFQCSGFQKIDIPNSVIDIENYAFFECFDLTSITIHNGHATIGFSAFEDESQFPFVFRIDQNSTWRDNKKCQYCGGDFTGFISKRCSKCNRKKDY